MSRKTDLAKSEPTSLSQNEERLVLAPPCDVYESKDEILVVADVPGVEPSALTIHVEKGELVLEARRERSTQEGALLGTEWMPCDFRRRFTMPSGIDAEKINAELKNGVMYLHLPKSAALKPRQIAVQAA